MSRGIGSGSGIVRRMTGRLLAGAAAVVLVLVISPPAHAANSVLEWNQIALSATVTANQGPLPQIRSMTLVHVAMHDAVNRITREYETYFDGRSPTWGGWGASADAAAIAAAHRTLVGLFPDQSTALDSARSASLAARGLSNRDHGILFGEAVARRLLVHRANDGSAQAQFPYTAPGAGNPGVWVAAGPAAPVTPGWGDVTPWVIRSTSSFMPDAPPRLNGRRYTRDYDEVKEIGSLTSTTRTAEQTGIARFWLASPSVIWNSVARQLVEARTLDISATARVFALIYLAAADASIVCWDAKYTFNFWRPITAIRQGDVDGNDHTVGDPAWAPLLTTPQHPEYVSGHSTNSSAIANVLKLVFGDVLDTPLVVTSPTNAGFERQWTSLSEGVDEVIDARVYGGIHYRTSNEEGAHIGRTVARHVVARMLRPGTDRHR
jgi:hypothetical protein